MALPNASDAAAAWAQRLASSSDKITKGIQAVTTSPGQAAARQKNLYLQQVQAAGDKWAARVAAVSTSEWQQAAISKGVPRIASGATAAQPKMEQFMSQLLPHIASQVASLPPRGGIDQNIDRMTRFVRGMATFSKR